jgi:hypothetical protein
VSHDPREAPLPGSGCREGGRGGTRPKGDLSTWKWVPCRWKGWDTSQGRPLYLEVGAMKMKGMGHVPRETSLPGCGCHENGRGGIRPKGDPSTWKWVPCRWKGWDLSQGRPLYLEVGAVQAEGVGHVPRETPLPGNGCRADGRGGTRPKGVLSTWKWGCHEDERDGTCPKGDPSTWKWVP